MSQRSYAVIGDPIEHSLSPVIHNTLYRIYGLDCHYGRLKISIDQLPAFFKTEAVNFAGFNVTMPLKQAVLPLLSSIHPDAILAQSVNTIQMDGLRGYSTDADGLKNAVLQAGHTYRDKSIFIYGAGGVTTALALSFAKEARRIRIYNRTAAKAEEICSKVSAHYAVDIQSIDSSNIEEALSDCDLFFNTTPLGMAGVSADFQDLSFLKRLPRHCLVTDLIYNPGETRLLRESRALGLPVLNGLPMLIHQGFLSFSIWFGIQPTAQDYATVLRQMPPEFVL